ncbi:hypothetical protein BCR33DRAFT_766268 [Rhizoclosmatium globosum]|uniref:Uncharacterized protein n=1 Tax=Rhizoclosmatium globosum TaxID=329046 RepID=A0A1Y2CCU1_9FUNG|nr:hypothetical protein BCR33DRAFT_766268 [Rhizoclosmatium globosum]|eukprot:ORY44135.1 hypothetical protein BCR33DRAFT_766268 [Rhizoclosmatium globosum]
MEATRAIITKLTKTIDNLTLERFERWKVARVQSVLVNKLTLDTKTHTEAMETIQAQFIETTEKVMKLEQRAIIQGALSARKVSELQALVNQKNHCIDVVHKQLRAWESLNLKQGQTLKPDCIRVAAQRKERCASKKREKALRNHFNMKLLAMTTSSAQAEKEKMKEAKKLNKLMQQRAISEKKNVALESKIKTLEFEIEAFPFLFLCDCK